MAFTFTACCYTLFGLKARKFHLINEPCMRQIKVWATISYRLSLLLLLFSNLAIAQTKPQPASESISAPFELKNGDRVVFLGNSLFENDFQYGYLELALTTRWPDRDVTFRNLGWTGDNVFGVARSTITNPPTAYELLMEHLTKAQPTVVFVAYGGIEAEEGEAGIPTFTEGLNKLLNKIDSLGAKAILVSPIPILTADSVANPANRNAMLERYSAVMAKMASARGKRFVDVFKPILAMSKTVTLTENGIHLNETGYYCLATILESELGLPPRSQSVTITTTPNTSFTISENQLPLPLPSNESGLVNTGQILKIPGLKKGIYTLTADGSTLKTASAKDWEVGVAIRQGRSFEQVRALRQMIVKKNELFFFQYRPPNTTYILGFRSYEQGRHAKGLEEQSIIIKWLEGQIAQSRKPSPAVYQLNLLK